MKYQIRKRENYTAYLSSEVAELDPKFFKKFKPDPYTGSTEEDFLKYISKFDFDEHRSELPSEVEDELVKILGGGESEMQQFGTSAEKYADEWFEVGEKDDKYWRYGNFNFRHSTKD